MKTPLSTKGGFEGEHAIGDRVLLGTTSAEVKVECVPPGPLGAPVPSPSGQGRSRAAHVPVQFKTTNSVLGEV